MTLNPYRIAVVVVIVLTVAVTAYHRLHPFYVTTALLMAYVTVLAENLLIGAGSLLVLGLLAVRTPKEEQMLIEKFGQQYRAYMAKTGRFFP